MPRRECSEGGRMKRFMLLAFLLVAASAAPCLAQDANLGTWKLNESKSNLRPGAPRNNTVVYAPAGDMVKITVDGIGGDGKPLHSEWTGRFDGKDYTVTGDPTEDARAYKKVDDSTTTLAIKKNGKITKRGEIKLAPDSRTRTVTLSGTGPNGKPFRNVAVYDKQ
jgi:hypothetical protein